MWNNIGGDGCKHLSTAQWGKLTWLEISLIIVNIGYNNIGDDGCKHLSTTQWGNLRHLKLGTIIFIEAAITLEMTAASI